LDLVVDQLAELFDGFAEKLRNGFIRSGHRAIPNRLSEQC
jgi:hypothetical protein